MRGLPNFVPGRPEGLRYMRIVLAALLLPTAAVGQTRRPINVGDLLAFHRISEPRISPDSASVVYTVTTPDRPGNKSVRNVWIVPIAGGAGPEFTGSGSDSSAERW